MRLALLTIALLATLPAPAGAQRADPPPVDPAATWALDGTRSMDAEVARGPLELAWAREYTDGIEVSAIGAGKAFATTDRAGLVALDAATGAVAWTATTDGVAERFEEPAVGVGGAFAVVSDGGSAGRYELSLLDAADGRTGRSGARGRGRTGSRCSTAARRGTRATRSTPPARARQASWSWPCRRGSGSAGSG